MKTTILELMRIEEALLLIERRHDNGELVIPFNLLLILKNELKKIGFITDLFIKEAEKSGNDLKNDAQKCEIDYDLKDCKEFLNSEIIKKFYNI